MAEKWQMVSRRQHLELRESQGVLLPREKDELSKMPAQDPKAKGTKHPTHLLHYMGHGTDVVKGAHGTWIMCNDCDYARRLA